MAFTSIVNGVDFLTLPTSSATPSSPTQLTTKTYVDGAFTSKTMSNSFSYTGTLQTIVPFNVSYGNFASPNSTTTLLPSFSVNFFFENQLTTLTFNDTCILNGLNISSALALTSMSGPDVVAFSGVLGGTYAALTTFSFPNLMYSANFAPVFSVLTTLSLPSLIAFSNVVTASAPLLTTFNVPLLRQALVGFSPIFASITTVSLPSFTFSATFAPTFALCTSLSVPVLSVIGSSFAPVLASITTLSLPSLTYVGTTFSVTAANLVTFSMGSTLKSIGGNFTLTGAKLDQASVDGILVSLAALDGTNGTTAYSSKTVNLSGGTNATPSATGLAAKVTLVARSCTVTNN